VGLGMLLRRRGDGWRRRLEGDRFLVMVLLPFLLLGGRVLPIMLAKLV